MSGKEITMGTKSKEILGKLQRSESTLDQLEEFRAEGEPSVLVDVRSEDETVTAASSVNLSPPSTQPPTQTIKTEYANLLSVAQELASERLRLEEIVAGSTKLENLDDLELAEQYLLSMTEANEVPELLDACQHARHSLPAPSYKSLFCILCRLPEPRLPS